MHASRHALKMFSVRIRAQRWQRNNNPKNNRGDKQEEGEGARIERNDNDANRQSTRGEGGRVFYEILVGRRGPRIRVCQRISIFQRA